MLTESFIASTLILDRGTPRIIKDAGISHYDFQPLQALKASFKKSSTQKNCLAVSTSHIFAAQADKSVVHVYSRDRGNQEAVVPFHDRIRSIALAADQDGGGVLALGTEGGGVIFWEVYILRTAFLWYCSAADSYKVALHWSSGLYSAVSSTYDHMFGGRSDIKLPPVWISRLEHTCVVYPVCIGIPGLLRQRPKWSTRIESNPIPFASPCRHKCDRDRTQRQ